MWDRAINACPGLLNFPAVGEDGARAGREKISQSSLFFSFHYFFFLFFFELPKASLEKLCFGSIDPTETVAALRFDVALRPVVDGIVKLEKKKKEKKIQKKSSQFKIGPAGDCCYTSES
jgi:hypothetical protein